MLAHGRTGRGAAALRRKRRHLVHAIREELATIVALDQKLEDGRETAARREAEWAVVERGAILIQALVRGRAARARADIERTQVAAAAAAAVPLQAHFRRRGACKIAERLRREKRDSNERKASTRIQASARGWAVRIRVAAAAIRVEAEGRAAGRIQRAWVIARSRKRRKVELRRRNEAASIIQAAERRRSEAAVKRRRKEEEEEKDRVEAAKAGSEKELHQNQDNQRRISVLRRFQADTLSALAKKREYDLVENGEADREETVSGRRRNTFVCSTGKAPTILNNLGGVSNEASIDENNLDKNFDISTARDNMKKYLGRRRTTLVVARSRRLSCVARVVGELSSKQELGRI